MWDLGLRRPTRVPWPVLSIGALTAGGAGKTPVTRWLARELHRRGESPAILTRGYSSGGGPEPRVVDPRTPDVARDGDEPVLLARTLPGVPVIVGADRARGAHVAGGRGAKILLLDDGFQHRRLARDFDLVLWDRRSERARGALLPAGPLREAESALRRADAVLLVDRGDGPPGAPRAQSPAGAIRLVVGAWQEISRETPIHAISGIADPEAFERALVRLGLPLRGATRYADHHPFTAVEIGRAAARAAEQGAALLATTAKDWMRWPRRGEVPVPAVFDLDVEGDAGQLVEGILTAIRRKRA
jgi:tetraacyldisaccharide 4'-kinase